MVYKKDYLYLKWIVLWIVSNYNDFTSFLFFNIQKDEEKLFI